VLLTTATTTITFSPIDALADSTGKFSTKATAKKRYLPRIKKGA
jgi:hypothetical protein